MRGALVGLMLIGCSFEHHLANRRDDLNFGQEPIAFQARDVG